MRTPLVTERSNVVNQLHPIKMFPLTRSFGDRRRSAPSRTLRRSPKLLTRLPCGTVDAVGAHCTQAASRWAPIAHGRVLLKGVGAVKLTGVVGLAPVLASKSW